jgi:hypothetical protein
VVLAAAIRDEEDALGNATGWRRRSAVAGALVGAAVALAAVTVFLGPSAAALAGGAAGLLGGAATALAVLAVARRRPSGNGR